MSRFRMLLAVLTVALAAASIVLITTAAPAEASTVSAGADTYVGSDAPTGNFGTARRLPVDGGPAVQRAALLRFDVEVPSGSRVTSVRLRAYNTSNGSAAGCLPVYRVGDGWSETTVTWENAPSRGPDLAGPCAQAQPGWVEWDVTAAVPAQGGRVALRVEADAQVQAAFASRESRPTDRRPQLVVQTATPATSSTSTSPPRVVAAPTSDTEVPQTTAPAPTTATSTPTTAPSTTAPSTSTSMSTTATAPGGTQPASGDAQRRYGTLQSTPGRLDVTAAAGINLVTLEVAWQSVEPVEGRVDQAYVDSMRARLAQFRAAGMAVVLDTGVQYPPAWLFAYPNSRYVDQYGDAWSSGELGKNVADMVFNQQMRDKQQAYLGRLFAALGTDFYGVRLGGGWYGELNYPQPAYNGRSNAYWGFDAVARGAAPGLPPGIAPNPVPGWAPGTSSPDHASARRFADWYLGSLADYQDWQITTARRWYGGRLLMMYPSWGVRPGQLDAAVAGDLTGTTSAERNGEVQRGFDVARFVGRITDPGVVLYTTWLNADDSGDAGADPAAWSPVHYLAALAAQHARRPAVMGENDGHDGVPDLQRMLSQARRYDLTAVVWAFEPELFSGGFATLADYADAIRQDRLG